MNQLKQLIVKKGEGIEVLRDENQFLYPDKNFQVAETTYVRRRINAGDLILVKQINGKDKPKNAHNNT